MSSANANTKKTLVIVGSVVALLVAVLVGGPLFFASSWKSKTLTATNAVIDKVNSSNRDISNYSSKLQPTSDDYTKLAAAYDTQMKAVEDAKKNLSEVGGLAGLDVTGDYKKAVDTRKELIAAYDELLALDKAGAERTKAEQEVASLVGSTSEPQNEQEAKALVNNVKDAAKKVQDFASTANGTEYDKKVATAFGHLATALEAMYSATDDMESSTAQMQVSAAVQELDDLQSGAEAAQKDFQKKIDKNIDRLNAAVKSLE